VQSRIRKMFPECPTVPLLSLDVLGIAVRLSVNASFSCRVRHRPCESSYSDVSTAVRCAGFPQTCEALGNAVCEAGE